MQSGKPLCMNRMTSENDNEYIIVFRSLASHLWGE